MICKSKNRPQGYEVLTRFQNDF